MLSRKLRSFATMPRRALLIEAAWELLCAALTVRCRSFRAIAARLGGHMQTSSQTVPDSHLREAIAIGRMIRTAARNLPTSPTCLPQALAAWRMLGRRRIGRTLYMGAVRQHDASLSAHAWLRVGPRVITGGPGHERYAVVATFASASTTEPLAGHAAHPHAVPSRPGRRQPCATEAMPGRGQKSP